MDILEPIIYSDVRSLLLILDDSLLTTSKSIKMNSKLLALVVLVFPLFMYSQSPTVSSTTYSFESQIQNWQNEHLVPAVGVGIIENGEIKLSKVYFANTEDTKNTQDFVFTIASLTKPFFATAALKLINANLLKLDEPLHVYNVREDIGDTKRHRMLTARHILSHQTGFPNWSNMTPSKKLTFYFDPGERHTYSGEGYEYLREVLDRKLKSNINTYCDSLLYSPLQMKNSRIESAAGGMQTTIQDYTRFCQHVLQGAGLSNELFQEMVTPQISVKEGLDFGIGWELATDLTNGAYAIMHSGSEPGYKTFAVLYPKSKSGVIVFTTGDNGNFIYENIIRSHSSLGGEVFDRVYKKYTPKQVIQKSIQQLKVHEGKYEISKGFVVEVFLKDNQLKGKIPGNPIVTLYPQSNDEFVIDETLSFKFLPKNTEKSKELHIYNFGIDSYVGKRID